MHGDGEVIPPGDEMRGIDQIMLPDGL